MSLSGYVFKNSVCLMRRCQASDARFDALVDSDLRTEWRVLVRSDFNDRAVERVTFRLISIA